ncbi:RILP-like protein 1 isoform X3 [Chiloscyllium plagiosum]|uniref:RILP-like protein 1 isoform X3 n=1 Tax=Chiloscyllium plagiosum TaxID=36176 RepID=UPI001CB7B5B8|nr:RILP-like protein 1 isoform X3 [Chiloscyllium plagiosum]
MDTEACLLSCLDKPASNLGVNDVYEIAKLIGTELEKLIDSHGKKVVEGLIPKIVRILEMLESFVTRNGNTEQELIRAFVRLQDGERSAGHYKDLDHKTSTWHKPIQELQKQISQLTDENQRLVNQLVEIQSQEDSLSKKEREVMLKLKEVVDQQRDEIRAKGHEIYCKNEDVDALQQQLDRVLKVNDDLRHKINVVQTQLRNVLEKKAELEVTVQQKEKEINRLQLNLTEVQAENTGEKFTDVSTINMADKIIIDVNDPNRPYFTKQEMRQILHERNELKANLFLVQEELAYYQREILNDEKCPAIFMEAIKSAIKKQRKKVKAKMLGIQENMCSSDEDDQEALAIPCFSPDEVDAKPPESKIKSINPSSEFRTTLQSIVSQEIQIWILELLCKVLSTRSPFSPHPSPSRRVGWSGVQTLPSQPSISLHDQLSHAIQVGSARQWPFWICLAV